MLPDLDVPKSVFLLSSQAFYSTIKLEGDGGGGGGGARKSIFLAVMQ